MRPGDSAAQQIAGGADASFSWSEPAARTNDAGDGRAILPDRGITRGSPGGVMNDVWMNVVAAVAVVAAIAYMVVGNRRALRARRAGGDPSSRSSRAVGQPVGPRPDSHRTRRGVPRGLRGAAPAGARPDRRRSPRGRVTSSLANGSSRRASGSRSSPSSPTSSSESSRRRRAASKRSSPGRKRPTSSSGSSARGRSAA